MGKAGKKPTKKITTLKEAALTQIAELEETPLTALVALQFFGENMTPEQRQHNIQEAIKEQETLIEVTNEAVETFEQEVKEENKQIKAAEEETARKAAEAARFAALASANSYSSGSTTGSSYIPSGESLSTRINRIMGGLPFSIGVTIAGCSGAEGCYNLGFSSISLNPSLAYSSDCHIAHVISHEYRHYVQYNQGLLTFDSNSNVTNVGWAESDANAFANSYGCA